MNSDESAHSNQSQPTESENPQEASLHEGNFNKFLGALEAIADAVLVAFKHLPLSPDENDNLVLDVAINGNADAILTNNIKDFQRPANQFGIEVMSHVEFLKSKKGGNRINAR